jgi:hypothetical protein
MAVSATEWAWQQSRAKNGSLIVLLAIADEIDNGREAVMSVAQLAAKAHLSERAVQAAASDLGRLGLMSVTRVKGGNAYRIAMVDHVPEGAESAPRRICTPQNLHPSPDAKPQVKAKGAESAPYEIRNVLDLGSVVSGEKSRSRHSPAKPARREPDRPDVERLCEHLASRIKANGGKANIGKDWRDAARLLIDRDGVTEEQAHRAIDWCQAQGNWWRSRIQSMPKLREKFSVLRMQAQDEQEKKKARLNGDPKLAMIRNFIEEAE